MALGAVVSASATPLIGEDLARFSVVSGGYATYGAGAVVSGQMGAVTYVVGGAGSSSGGDNVNTSGVNNAMVQLSMAQQALNRMDDATVLSPTVGGIIDLKPGVYTASALTTAAGTTLNLDGGGIDNPYWVFNIPTYLVTGASTKINIVNAGANASVFWNTGGYVAMGASTSFLGTVLSGAYISQGAGSDFACGNLFASSYVSVAAGSRLTSTNCEGTDAWAGSLLGLGAGLDIVNGVAQSRIKLSAAPTDISEPGSLMMLFGGLGLIAYTSRLNKKV